MKALTPRALGALLLLALAPAARAADAALDRPDDFPRLADGSLERRGEPGMLPSVFPRPAWTAGGSRLTPADAAARGTSAVPPPAPAAPPTPLALRWDLGHPFAAAGLLAAGTFLLLVAGYGLEPGIGDAPAAARAEPAAPEVVRPLPPPAREAPALGPPPPAARPALAVEAPRVETPPPAPSRRAISWREQSLIEGWDASREKALGQASLDEYLSRAGFVSGVDVPLLREKLRRDDSVPAA